MQNMKDNLRLKEVKVVAIIDGTRGYLEVLK